MNANDKYIKRNLFDKVVNHLNKKEITLIIGPRQVGKTVLLKQIQEYLVKEKKIASELIYYFNLDIISDRELFQDQSDFIEFIKQRSAKEKIFVFVDEAQKIKNAGVFFKGVYDSELNVKLFLTGSSTLEIKSKIQESLTGRKKVFQLLPFSFSEIISFKDQVLYDLIKNGKTLVNYDNKKTLKIFSDYCVWGGYPRVVISSNKEEKEDILKEIFTSYIEKDIVGFLKIENENNFIKLVRLLSAQINNLINVAELSSLTNTDRYSIDRYLVNLEKTFIIHNLKPFYSNARQEIVKASKVYFIDNGLRNMALESLQKPFTMREDKGALLENAVIKELLILKNTKNFNLKFWRSKQKAEVDFIIEKGLDVIPLEVKCNLTSNKLEPSFLGFITRYQPKKALIVNLGYQGKRKIKKTMIHFIYPYEIDNYI